MSALRKVLVVDDDPVVGKSFNRVLSGKGYAVITASNGQEALTKLEAEDYDVVFTDIKMPGMSGLEMAERVKERRPWMPVVIVTGYPTIETAKEAVRQGAYDYLAKPVGPDEVISVANGAMTQKKWALHRDRTRSDGRTGASTDSGWKTSSLTN